MAKYICKYGRNFCGNLSNLCPDCNKDAEAARHGKQSILYGNRDPEVVESINQLLSDMRLLQAQVSELMKSKR